MDKKELTARLARQAHMSQGKAADHLDRFVYNILRDLKDDVKPMAKDATVAAPAPPPSKANAGRRKP